MAKNKFDPNSAFKKITGLDESEEAATPAPAVETEAKSPLKSKSQKVAPEKVDFIGAYYRISPKHAKAIKIREAFSTDPKDKDKSSIVRAALDLYLSEELKKL